MAKWSTVQKITLPDEFERQLTKIGDRSDEAIKNALTEGGREAAQIARQELRSVLSTKEQNGELVNALGCTPPLLSDKGVWNVKIGFNEPRRKQYKAKKKRSYYTITNAMIANVIEHGKSGQPARPFMARAKRKSKSIAESVIRKKMEEELMK